MTIFRGMDTASGELNDKVPGNFQDYDFLADAPQNPERHDTAIMFSATGGPSGAAVMIGKVPVETRRRGPEEEADDETEKLHAHDGLLF